MRLVSLVFHEETVDQTGPVYAYDEGLFDVGRSAWTGCEGDEGWQAALVSLLEAGEGIMDIVHEAHFASSYTDARENMIMRVRDMVNEGKPEAEWVSRVTALGWFGVKPPSWITA